MCGECRLNLSKLQLIWYGLPHMIWRNRSGGGTNGYLKYSILLRLQLCLRSVFWFWQSYGKIRIKSPILAFICKFQNMYMELVWRMYFLWSAAIISYYARVHIYVRPFDRRPKAQNDLGPSSNARRMYYNLFME